MRRNVEMVLSLVGIGTMRGVKYRYKYRCYQCAGGGSNSTKKVRVSNRYACCLRGLFCGVDRQYYLAIACF